MSYIGAAANIAGGEIQGWASVLDKWAMEQAYRDQQARLAAFQKEATGYFRPQDSSLQAMQAGMGQGQTNRENTYAQIERTPLAINQPGMATAGADANWNKLLGDARAKLGSYSDWAVMQAINNLQTQQKLNNVTQQAQGQANIFPLRMYQAQHSNDTLSAIGQAISSIGGSAPNFASTFGSSPNTGQQAPGLWGGQTQQQVGQMFGYPQAIDQSGGGTWGGLTQGQVGNMFGYTAG